MLYVVEERVEILEMFCEMSRGTNGETIFF